MNNMCGQFKVKSPLFTDSTISELNEEMTTDEVIAVLQDAVVKEEVADALFISIYSERESVLNCRHVMLPEGYEGYSYVYKHYFFKKDEYDPVPESFIHNQVTYVDSDQVNKYIDTTQTRFERLKITEMVNIPLTRKRVPFGVLTLYNTGKKIDREKINYFLEHMTPILNPLYFACKFERLLANEKYVLNSLNAQEQSMYLSKQVFSLTSPEEIYETITKDILKLFPYSLAAIVMQDEDDLLRVKETAIASDDYSGYKKIYDGYFRSFSHKADIAEGATPTCFVLGIPFDFEDVQSMPIDNMSPSDKEGLRLLPYCSTVHVPIKHKGIPAGVLSLVTFDKKVKLSSKEVRQICMLCEFFGAAIDSAKIHAKAKDQAHKILELHEELEGNYDQLKQYSEQLKHFNKHDGKTGLKNFASYREAILQRFSEEERYNEDLSILMIDIDKFKDLNDKYSHVIADKALVFIADKIKEQVRAMDLSAYRFGGEEIVVLLPRCNLEDSRAVAERIRVSICETQFDSGMTPEEAKAKNVETHITVTVSIGCAQKNDNDDPDSLLERADAAMYSAKNSGRNKVEVVK